MPEPSGGILSPGDLNLEEGALLIDRHLVPMEPISWPAPFDHPDWLFQPKWDGVRMLAYVRGREVRLINRRGRERTGHYPEIVEGIRAVFQGQDAVFDGEIVVFWEGRPSFPRVMRREAAAPGPPVAVLRLSLPATYMVFDLLHLDGRELINLELEARLELLYEHLVTADPVLLTDSFEQGSSLFAAVEERGWEGIVAKRRGSPYRFGKSPLWRKIKVRRRQPCVVGGFTVTSHEELGSLLLGVWREEKLLYVGRAGSGLGRDEREALIRVLAETVQAECPFDPVPRTRGLVVRWVTPLLTVLVEYSEWTEGLHLRHPVVLGLNPVPVSACRLP
ncbi:MAG: non-homologous end-joining DNA ligase [Moorellales bacterium]